MGELSKLPNIGKVVEEQLMLIGIRSVDESACINRLMALEGAIRGAKKKQLPDFENFEEYEDDFNIVKNFLVDFNITRNDATPLIVDLNSRFLTIGGYEISDSTIQDSVKAIYDKGFTYIELNDEYMIFWKDKTGDYGVLWSWNSQKSISDMVKNPRPYMKSRKLINEWYEVGALASI